MSDLIKSDVEEIIDDGLNNKETLIKIKDKLKSITDYWSDYDDVFVEVKYCELLIDRWLVESGEYIRASTNPHQLHETIKVIKTVGNLNDCCTLIGNLAYNIIVNDLNNNSKLLKTLERKCVHRFKEVCLDSVSIQTSTITTEIAFVEECIELFKTSQDPTSISSDIQISDFLNGNDACIDFRNFLYNLQDSRDRERKYSRLKELANDLLKENNYYLAQGLKETVLSYLKPVIILEKFIDGRVVLEVSGKYIVLSRIASEVEQEPRFSRIEEVRFVSADIIHVDVDLSANIWHGKNVVVHSNAMVVSKNCVWNVSGNDGKETNRITDENGKVESSLSALQGNSGESGGNILILLNQLRGGENLQIVSNGGNGSTGLDGENGEDGIDGETMTDNLFKSLYPPVSVFRNSGKNTNLKETRKNIMNILKSVDCLYYNGVNHSSVEANQEFCSGTLFDDSSKIDSLYFEVTTNSGSKILFSFYNEILEFCQSFLLYKGSAGTEGKPGSCGGRGGNRGFGGEIDVIVRNDNSSKILKCSLQGQKGSSGKDGLSGKPGKYGMDKAYMDNTFTLFGEDWPKYFCPRECDNITLTVTYTNDKAGSAKVFAKHKEKYAEITQTSREMRSSCSAQRERLNDTVNLFKENSCRQKTISIESIKEMYGENESIANISEISAYVGNALEVLDNLGEEAFDVDENSEEVSVTRKISFESNSSASIDWFKCLADFSHARLEPKYISKDSTLLLKQVQHNSNDLITLTNLAFVSMNLDQLNMLWKILEQLNGNHVNESKIKNLKNIFFCDKYKLAVLEHLESNEFGNGFNLVNYTDLIANYTNASVKSGLIQKKQQYDRVASFFVDDSPEKREEVVHICENFTDDECVKTSIQIFLQEFGNSITMPRKCKEILNQNLSFEQRKVDQLKQTLELLKCELMKPENNNLHQDLIQSIISDNGLKLAQFLSQMKSLKLNLECGLLNKLFARYLSIYKKRYTWIGLEDNKGDVDSDIRSEFYYCIRQISLKSRCYINLLAFHFDINIVIFTCNESSKLELIDNYNSQSSKRLFLLKEDNLYSEIKINEEIAQIIMAQVSKGKTYSNTMLLIDSIEEKRDFDDFIDKALHDKSLQHEINKSTIIKTRVLNIISQDDDVKLITNAFVLPDERTMLCTRLEKLKLEFSGNEIILHFMALHFKTEAKSVSAKELCFIINILLKYTLEDSIIMPLITWIIAAFPHSRWLSELTLLRIETHLKKTLESGRKSLWREYLNKQNNETLMLLHQKINDEKDSNFDVQSFEEVLCLISNIPNAFIGLEEVSISEWKYYLKDRYWLYKVTNATNNCSEDQIKLIAYYLLSLENKKGTSFCEKIVLLMDAHKQSLTESDKSAIENTLRFLAGDEICIDDDIFGMFSVCPISEWPDILKTNISHPDQYRSVEELIKLMKSSDNTTEHVLTSLDNVVDALGDVNIILDQLKKKIRDESQLSLIVEKVLDCILRVKDTEISVTLKNSQYYLNVIGFFDKLHIKHTIAVTGEDNSEMGNIDPEYLNRILVAIVVFSIKILLKKELRETQKLAILTFLKSGKNILGQIATGEGKSLIVVSIAIIKAVLSGHSVDVITSSNVLAQRDSNDYKKVYSLFHVGVGNNCSQHLEDRKKAYSNCKVVYGELSSFQRDYLLDRFYSKNILGDRKFELVIVDEVDSMLLDQSNNILYLSHEIPGVDQLEPIFVFIWKWLNMPNLAEEISITISTLKDAIEFDLFGVIKMQNIRDLDLNLTENQLISTWEYLINEGVIDSNGHLLKQCIDDEAVTVKNRPNCIPEYHFRYLLKNAIERRKQLEVPNHLKGFVKAHLNDWIQSAVNALKLEINVHYVVDVVHSPTNTSRTANIILLDSNTGTDMVNSHWDEGLHQFLQLKHGCRLSLISLKAVFRSNVSYFKQYDLLYGLTGTLGSIHDRDVLKEMYSVEFVTIPTAKPTKLLQNVPQVHQCTESWISAIIENTYDVSEKRSVLVVCETIKDVSNLEEKFNTFLSNKQKQRTILSYKRDYELIEASKGIPLTAEAGHIILSTNLAGRGTDIKISSDLKNAGGLQVCLTFLPTNSRIEEQAYGRVARNGEPGSSQLIIKNLVNADSVSKIIDLKKERDLKEHSRITNIKKHYELSVKVEEGYFEKFSTCYENLQKSIKSPNEEMKKILLQDCLDQWAFWLDSHSRNPLMDPIDSFLDKLSKYINIDIGSWFQHLKNPSRLLHLGLKCLKMQEYKIAISCFDQVIKSEPSFSESALYYIPSAKAKYMDIVKDDFAGYFEKARELFKKRVDTLLMAAQIVDWLKIHNTKSSLQIDSFKEQKENVINTYMLFINSIDQVLGCGVDYDHEIRDVANDLIRKKVIIDLKIKKGISENDLKFLEDYGIAPNKMIEFFNTCNGQLDIKTFKQCFALPSKELFWKELLKEKVLIYEEKYVFVDTNQVEQYDPLLAKIIMKLKIEVEPTNKNQLWIYDFDFINGIESYSVCRKGPLLVKIGIDNYRQLKAKGVLHSNKRASLVSSIQSVNFKLFNSLTHDDFEKIGICNATAVDILFELEKNKVISSYYVKTPSSDKIQFCLLLDNVDQINCLELKKCKAYTEDVRSLLRFHFSFGLAMKGLLNLQSSNQYLKINLNTKPHSSLVHVLIEQNVVKSVVNSTSNYISVLKGLYRVEMSLDDWKHLFTNIYDKEKAKQIISELIEKKWLLQTNRLDPRIWMETKYKLNLNKEGKINKTAQLPVYLQNDSDVIEFILLGHVAKANRVDEYVSFLDTAKGFINKVETPGFDLKPLNLSLMNNKLSISELSLFNLNGIDQILQLGEKTWTWKMKRDTFIATVLGLAQIAVGSSILCMNIVKTGIDSLIHCFNCMITGTFHWKDYFINMVISLVNIFNAPLLKIFSSSFGSSVSFSVDSLKTAGYKFINACKQVTGQMITSCKGDFLVSVFSRVAKAIGSSAISNTLHNAILPKIEHLGKLIVGLFDKSIEEILKSHGVIGTAQQLCNILGQNKTKDKINAVCLEVGEKYRSSRNHVWLKAFSNIKAIINNAKNLMNPKFSLNFQDIAEKVGLVLRLHDMISTLFQKEEYKMIINPINHFLNTLETHLQKEITIAETSRSVDRIHTLENHIALDLSLDVIFQFKDTIKNEINSILNESIIHPLFQTINDRLTNMFLKITNKTFNKFFSNKEKSLIDKDKGTNLKNQNCNLVNKTKGEKTYVDREYDDCLIQILKTRKHNAVFAEIMKQNTEIDVSCLTFLCSVIPMVLKKHGINVPNLELTVQRSGVKEFYKTSSDKPASLSITIATNDGFLFNIQSNKVLVKGLLKAIVLPLLPSDPQVQTIVDTILEEIIKFLEGQVPNKDYEENVKTEYKSSLTSEYDSYQHSHPDGSWTINPNVNCYIAEEENESKVTLMEPLSDYISNHIHNGFMVALSKLNNHIHRVQSHLKPPFNLTLYDFDESKFDIFPPTSSDLNMFHGRAVDYKLIMPFKVAGRELINFVLTLKLVNQVCEIQPFTPYGPHIVFQVEPINEAKYMALGVKGHVLLDKKCATGKITSKDCHIAGNLILPTGFKLIRTTTDARKAIDVLLLRDLYLKYAQQDIKNTSWEIALFQNVDSDHYTTSVITNLVRSLKTPKCIIFHLGTSLVQAHGADKEIAERVIKIVEKVMSYFQGAKVVMFALHQRKFAEEILNPTIIRVNGRLKTYCLSMKVTYVETSMILMPDDLDMNGKDLNKKGCKKLMKFYDKIAQKYVM